MRVAYVYDRCFPYTIGGAERWYHELALRVSNRHDATFLTRRHWPADKPPLEPFRIIGVAGPSSYYAKDGRRRILPAIYFGIRVFWHLLRHANDYDVVHTASFPYFSVIGAWLALRIRGRTPLVVDWHEVWPKEYWQRYIGPIGGTFGFAVEKVCMRIASLGFTFSKLNFNRLLNGPHRGPIIRLTGQLSGVTEASSSSAVSRKAPIVVFAGRHIPEKGVTLIPETIRLVRQQIPEVEGIIFGDGPLRDEVERSIQELQLEDVVELRGFAPRLDVEMAIRRASCLLLPSTREGYGLVVVEAAQSGTPVVTIDGADNAAAELVETDVNGILAKGPDPTELAEAVIRVLKAGADMQSSTLSWFRHHSHELSLEDSVDKIESVYARFSIPGTLERPESPQEMNLADRDEVGVPHPRDNQAEALIARYEEEAERVQRYAGADYWEARYGRKRMWHVERILEHAITTGKNFLDSGCGSGEYLAIAEKAGAAVQVGLDLAFNYAVRARTNAPTALLLQGSLERLPLRDSSFDVVLCSEVLEHIPADVYSQAVAELFRVTSFQLIITTPNRGFLRRPAEIILPKWLARMDRSVGHLEILDLKTLVERLSRVGWTILDSRTVHVMPGFLGRLIPRWIERLVSALERLLDRWLPRAGNISLVCLQRAASS